MPKVKIPARRPPRTSTRSYPPSPSRAEAFEGKLIAIDPGYTTGICMRLDKDVLVSMTVTTDEEVLRLLPNMNQVVVERFETAGRLSAPGLYTIMLVGQIVGYCKAKKISIELATPQSRHSFMRDAEAQVGYGKLIEPSKLKQHQIDSLAHLLAWEYRNGKTNTYT